MKKQTIIHNKQTGETNIVNTIDLSERFSEKMNISKDKLKNILKDVKELFIESFKETINQKDENGKVKDNFIEIQNICAFYIRDIEKDDKKYYEVNVAFSEDIINSINK